MEVNYEMQEKIFDIIDNQIIANDLPEVNKTFLNYSKFLKILTLS